MAAFWHLAGRMRRYRWTLLGALAMAFLAAGSMGAALVGTAPVLRSVLGEKQDLRSLAERFNEDAPDAFRLPPAWIDALPTGPVTAVACILAALGVLAVLSGSAGFLHAYLSLTVVNRTITGIRRELFHRVLRLPMKTVARIGAGDAVSRIVADTAQLQGGLTALTSRAVAQAMKCLASVTAALIVEWRIALIGLLVAPPIFGVIQRTGRRIKRSSRAALESQALMTGSALEAVQGLKVIKTYTGERREAGRFHRINKRALAELNRVRTARAVASPLVEVLTVLTLGLMTALVVKPILDGHIEPARFVATLVMLATAGATVKPLIGAYNDVQASSAAAERIVELLSAEPEPGHGTAFPRPARHARSIELHDVTFSYPGADRPALRGVSLIIPHGQRVAIVGPNGCGKTTLLGLIPRLYDPDEGQVLLDGADVRGMSIRGLRAQIGVVTQEVVLFRGTIASNIAYGAEGATPESIRDAARRARAAEFIEALPAGYDTEVGDQGLTLSGGQRQRVAIARAIARDPAILILDEATSMIDADSEAAINEALAEFARGRTTLVVAHRLSTVLRSDRIIVMDAGRIVDEGRHDDLLARSPVYRTIARTQLLPPAGGG